MKKKTCCILLIVAFCIIMGIVIVVSSIGDVVLISNANSGTAVFRHNDLDLEINLTDQELSEIFKLFNGKLAISDSPSCGFSEDVAITISKNGDQVFYLGQDDCGMVYWKNRDKYFQLSEVEKNKLHAILEDYGFYFPCV